VARWVIHEDALDELDTEPVMRKVAEDIAADARRFAAKGKTLGLSGGISVTEVSDSHAIIESTAVNPRSSPEHADYPYFVEKGTHRSKARPYMRPAAYRYRTP
jgi:NH3-dependent NAD+ synthetase